MSEYTPENWGTIGPEVEGLRARIEKLERRMNRFELVHEQHVAQAIESRNQRDERIEALEAAYGPFGTHNETHNHVNKRLEKLEEKATSVDCVRVHRDIAEDERQDRWHATRDAALMGLLAKDACSGCHNDEFIRSATVFADRAHGPLEAKAELPELDAPDGPNWPFGMTKPEDIGEFMNGVGAVLKALDSMVRTFADRGSDYWLKDLEECERRARAALKPFEVKP